MCVNVKLDCKDAAFRVNVAILYLQELTQAEEEQEEEEKEKQVKHKYFITYFFHI